MSNKEEKKDSALLEDSIPKGTERREVGPAEATRRKINHGREGRTALGTGKSSTITIGK